MPNPCLTPQAKLHLCALSYMSSTLRFALPSSQMKYVYMLNNAEVGSIEERTHSPSDRCTYHITQTQVPGVIPPRATSTSLPHLPILTFLSFLSLTFPSPLFSYLHTNIPKTLLFPKDLCTYIAFLSIIKHNGTKDPPRPPRTRAAQPVRREHQDPRPRPDPSGQAAVCRAAKEVSPSSWGRSHRIIAHKTDVVHRPPELRGRHPKEATHDHCSAGTAGNVRPPMRHWIVCFSTGQRVRWQIDRFHPCPARVDRQNWQMEPRERGHQETCPRGSRVAGQEAGEGDCRCYSRFVQVLGRFCSNRSYCRVMRVVTTAIATATAPAIVTLLICFLLTYFVDT